MSDGGRVCATVQRLWREPLLHFVLLGAALFAIYGALNRGAMDAPDEIVVDQARIDALDRGFQQLWRRPPTQAELQGLVDDWVRDEILYREGVAAGLDRDDPVIRRRVAQKLRYLSESRAAELPTDHELQRWLDQHAADYRIEARYTLRQVYVDPARHARDLDATLARTLASLKRGDAQIAGDATLLPSTVERTPPSAIERTFGDEFSKAIATLPVGEWQGPVQSGFGLHFVRIDARSDGRDATLAEVRSDIERDVMSARAADASKSYFDDVRSRYTVVVEGSMASRLDLARESGPPAGSPTS